ncbi:hypothetical protein Y5W_00506 [Alcanivorax sp. 521-1]|uniref:DUF560 domain-containing protein n=1 Tax=Alloalcanivorax profundimaris TaxID=2735259 RepID=A0ABS0AM53_9GAMM|nr:surface lipoprotein assembly modifier [Alloalcanivorax profundimaris]MBF5055212.1 hypothetical protein [Alloalcanivorax profundimaris]
MNQGLERSAQEREQDLLEEERAKDEPLPDLIINGQTYQVRKNRDDLGRGLYVALRNRNWAAAARFLEAYRALANPDPLLVHYAQGKLARLRGELETAEAEFRALLALKPAFLPGRLELARVLFENHENREARRRFRDIRDGLPEGDPRADGVRATVTAFLEAIDERGSWQGRLAAGPSYSDNVNLSSESAVCLLMFSNGACFISRSVPEAIKTEGLDFEAALEKTFFLPGHHGLFLRTLAYGDRYRDHSIHNQGTYSASAGYRFRDMNDLYSLAPLFEHARYGNDDLYDAWGARAEWMHYFSPRTAFKLEGNHKRMRYLRDQYSRFDGDLSSVYTTVWHRLGADWTLFGGLDGSDRDTEEDISSYEQYGVRVGLSKPLLDGVEMTLFASLREKRYDAYSALLEARREDREQHYMAILRIPRLSVAGLVPSLNLEHTRVRSNVDWLYSYEENAASLKFEWRF